MKATAGNSNLRTAIVLAIAVTLIGWLLGPALGPVSGLATPVFAQDTESLHLNEDYVLVSGDVWEGDLQVMRGDLVVEKGARVEGDVLVMAGDGQIDGDVEGGIAVIGGSLTVSGGVNGDILVVGAETLILGEVDGDVVSSGTVKLGSNAIVTGDVISPSALDREQGAIVLERDIGVGDAGVGVSLTFADERPPTAVLAAAGLLATLLPALFAALVAAIAPGTVHQVADLLGRRGAVALVLGVLAWAALPFLMVVLLPLAPLALGLFLVIAALGFVGIATRIGRRLVRDGRTWIQAGVGGGALGLPIAVGLVAGPWLGGTAGQIVFVAALVAGSGVAALAVGAALFTIFEAGNRTRKAKATFVGPPGGAPRPPESGSVLSTTAAAEAAAAAAPAHPHGATRPMSLRGAADAGEAHLSTAPAAGADDPVSALSGVQPLYAYLFGQAGIRSLGDLASSEPDQLVAVTNQPGVTPIGEEVARAWIVEARRMIGD